MGGFTGLFDRPDPTVARLTKNPRIQRGIDATLQDWNSARTATRSGLQDYITNYLAGNADATKYAGQETGAIDAFYNGDMQNQLANLRAKRSSAVNSAADLAVQEGLRNVNLSNVTGQGGGGSYNRRLAVGAVLPVRTAAALDSANQERSDLDYLTGNRIALAGARTGIADRLASRALVPGQVSQAALTGETSSLAPIVSLDQANRFYGIHQDPGLLDRMQQETQFLQGLQSIMKNQYGTAAEAYGGWAGMGGGGGGGMGGGMGMGMMGMRRGGVVTDYTRGGNVDGPGTGTSDSIPARLSDGEYVVPASAVRIPGVLPLLEKIRRMGGEGATTEESARRHFASGGLYADSWGGLGAQSLARDQFNESVVSQQQAQQIQSQQFEKSNNDANNRSILQYYRQWKDNQASPTGSTSSTPYMPMNNAGNTGETQSFIPPGSEGELPFARGGLVYRGGGLVYRGMTYPSNAYMAGYRASDRIPYGDRARATANIRSGEMAQAYEMKPEPKFADGGLVGGDDLPNNSSEILSLLAKKAAREMLNAGPSQSVQQRRLDLEDQRNQSYEKRADRQLKLQEDYQDYLMHQPTAATQRSTQLRDAALAQAAEEGISPDDNLDMAQGASPEGIAMARQRALTVRPFLEQRRDRAVSIANLRNQAADLQTEAQQLKDNPPPAAGFRFNLDAAQGERDAEQRERLRGTYATRLQRNTRALQGVTQMLGKIPPAELDQTSYFDPQSGRYVPSVPEVGWRGRASAAAAAAPATGASTVQQGFEGEYKAYQGKYPQAFYDRVNQLVGQGVDPRDAKTQAMREWGK